MSRTPLPKPEIIRHARDLGAEFVGFAPVSRWDDFAEVPADFRPRAIWPLAKTVIVIAVPLWLPIVEAAPSQLGREQYIITNELLDEASYRLAVFLNRHGHAAINLPRDGQGEPEVLAETTTAIFSHVWAGHYAGIGEVGWNHCLVTREFGPRHRLVSVLTALKLEGDPMLEEGSLCNKCLLCQKACPTMAFSGNPRKDRRSNMNKFACFSRRDKFKVPQACGYCLKVCPVGEDRKLYQSLKVNHYFEERKAFFAANQVSLDPVHPLNVKT